MKMQWVVRKVVKVALVAIIVVAVFGLVVMGLWNWLMTDLFGLRVISFLQAIGLLILSRLLLGGFHGRGGSMHWRHRMRERWERMSPEERERLRRGMGCSESAPPEPGQAV